INRSDVAKSFTCAAIDVLVEKAFRALKETGLKTLTVSGGVAANGYLRESLTVKAAKENIKLVLPEKRYCTDNGAMIGAEGYLQYKKGNFADLTLNAKAVIPL
ncbi:MAG: tRNA (adenosine(37)-N6)-threonylcarbamoyltransferase complex transferase subunit TsaD, partial [Clostridia bacterium]|nr:tRNA (adenosine(37)-N6)-threonylcarbamoyltransferase complex transferase subunit TsaD [Clostridia bacterium]